MHLIPNAMNMACALLKMRRRWCKVPPVGGEFAFTPLPASKTKRDNAAARHIDQAPLGQARCSSARGWHGAVERTVSVCMANWQFATHRFVFKGGDMRRPGWIIFWLFATVVAWISLSLADSSAQSYPTKPIHIIVGFAAGGATDVIARQVAQKLSESMGQPVVVDNQPGASTAIATERLVRSRADGYTLLLIPISTAVQTALRTDLPYDLERDLAAVSQIASGPFVLVVHPSVPARNVKELIVFAQSQPGKLSYGSPGVGSAHHLVGELFNSRANVKTVHVPFKGAADADMATASGQLQLSFTSPAGALPFLERGRIRPLAVTSATRLSLLPAVPTLDESGLPGFDYSAWYGLSAPAGVPKGVIMQLNTAVKTIVHTPEMKEILNKQGFEPQTGTPEAFAAVIRHEIEQTTKLIQLTGMKVE
jgi:tripartite-type tricarboxylate transporter receptor subunit TctC